MTLGARIKSARRRSGLSQERVAESVGVSRQAVTKWERDRSAPSTENLFKLAELFDTTVDLLLEGPGEARPNGESLYQEYKEFQLRFQRERREKMLKNLAFAGLLLLGWLGVYLLGRVIWCDWEGSSILGWLLFDPPEGEHSYLFGWLTHQKIFWWAMLLSVLPACVGKRTLSLSMSCGFVLGLLLGILFGPNPKGIPYGQGDYGWLIWGITFLLPIPVGIFLEKRRGGI